MDDDTSRAARQRALAEKKRRLEEIKARRRQPNISSSSAAAAAAADDDDRGGGGIAPDGGGGKNNLDSYIDGLLKSSTPSLSLVPPPPPPATGDDDAGVVARETASGGETPAPAPRSAAAAVVAAPPSATTAPPGDGEDDATGPRRTWTETFDVAVQCCAEDDLAPPSLVSEDDDDDDDEEEEGEGGDLEGGDGQGPKTATTATTDGGPPSSSSSDPAATAAPPSTSPLSPDERSRVLASRTFARFLSDAGRRVERLLGAGDDGIRDMMRLGGGADLLSIDFGVDHADDDDEDDDGGAYDGDDAADGDNYHDDGGDGGAGGRRRRRRGRGGADGGGSRARPEAYRAGGHLVARSTYEFPRFTRGRSVTDVEWCPGHAEWVAASYSSSSSGGGGGGAAVVDGGGEGAGAAGAGAAAFGRRDPTTRRLSPLGPPSSFLQGGAAAPASHFASSAIPDEGIVAVYNLSMPNRPEHLFCAGCPILRCRFHPTEGPRLVVGGGSSGQVLVWDARAGRYPVQRSGASGGGHDRELVGMRVLGGGEGGGGSISSSMLVTASSDGTVNYWSASNLREPVERIVVDANLSCLDLLHGVSEGLLCGDERGGLHAVLPGTGRDGTGTSKRVVRVLHPGGASAAVSEAGVAASAEDGAGATAAAEGPSETTGHYGVVTGVAARNVVPALRTPRGVGTTASIPSSASASRGFSRGLAGLVVTTGVDWSTKLWAPAHRDGPLTSFLSNSYDSMCDAQWSPVHPSIFATASSNGTINIWNLASTLDQPVSGTEGISVDGGAPDDSSSSCQGLNRIQWSSDGRRLAVASGDKLHVLGVGEHVWKAKGDEEGRVIHNLISRGFIQQE